MYAHEALLLGSTVIKPLRGVYLNTSQTQGCAMGMIAVASGQHSAVNHPWLHEFTEQPFPCGCVGLIMGGGGMMNLYPSMSRTFEIMVVHLFNQHVCDGSWTIEQLADWIKSVDPTIKLDSPKKENTFTESLGEPYAGQVRSDSERSDFVQVLERVSSSEIQLQPS